MLAAHIADGGMGSVWTATNDTTSAEVAVKLWRRRAGDESTVERLRQEARLGSRLSHRNIVRIFDLVEEPTGPLVLVMELLRGCSLERYLQMRGALDTRAAIAVAVAILGALSEAHDKGIIHRDLKPANVFLAVDHDGRVIPKLLDFGIAKMPKENKNLTEDGRSLGTPRYMSPEQIRGNDLDGRSDVFSTAIVLYEALTNVSPFDSGSSGAMLAAVLEREVDPHPLIPPRVWVELSRALSKRSYERHASAEELRRGLLTAMQTAESELEDALKLLRPMDIAPAPPRATASQTNDAVVQVSGERPSPRFSVAAKAIGAFAAAALFTGGAFVALSSTRSSPATTQPSATESAPQTPPRPRDTSASASASAAAATTTAATTAAASGATADATGKPTATATAGAPTSKPTAKSSGTKPIVKPVATNPGF